MRPSLIDTDILSMFLRNHPEATDRFASYLARYRKMNISIITYYEIMSGLKHRDARKKTASFLEFASENRVLPLTEQSVTASAEIYAELRKEGKPLDDIDLLIAGIAVENRLVLVTHNHPPVTLHTRGYGFSNEVVRSARPLRRLALSLARLTHAV